MKEFKKTAVGSPLPRNGACAFFYQNLSYAGQTLPVKSGKKTAFFHIEHDDVVQEICAGTPSVGAEAEASRVFLAVIFRTGASVNHVNFNFDLNLPDSVGITRQLLDSRVLEIHLLNMVYGEIVREQSIIIPLPADVLATIKKAAG